MSCLPKKNSQSNISLITVQKKMKTFCNQCQGDLPVYFCQCQPPVPRCIACLCECCRYTGSLQFPTFYCAHCAHCPSTSKPMFIYQPCVMGCAKNSTGNVLIKWGSNEIFVPFCWSCRIKMDDIQTSLRCSEKGCYRLSRWKGIRPRVFPDGDPRIDRCHLHLKSLLQLERIESYEFSDLFKKNIQRWLQSPLILQPKEYKCSECHSLGNVHLHEDESKLSRRTYLLSPPNRSFKVHSQLCIL